jgi:3-hydroxybutyryl-CoA dehydrogenase
MAAKEHFYITGDAELVADYARLSAQAKQSVSIRVNPGSSRLTIAGTKKVVSPPRNATVGCELTNLSTDIKRKNLQALARALPAHVPILTSSVVVTVAEQSTWVPRPERLVGIGAFPSLLKGEVIELARGPVTSDTMMKEAEQIISLLGKSAKVVQDTIGMVMPRILSMITNEAYFAMNEGVATGNDIDTAMKLGTNYPAGPVELASTIGVPHVCALLAALHSHFGEDRYRTAPLLLAARFVVR